MKCGFSKFITIGRLGRDPKAENEKTVSFPIWTSEVQDGKEVTKSEMILVFGKQRELCMEHLHKGDLCCIEGKLTRETYQSDKLTETAIVAERITFLSRKTKKENENV